MVSVLFGLSSALGYGVSDYVAGPAARRFPPILLVLFSQAAQAVVVLAVLSVGVRSIELGSLAWGMAAGVLNAVALIAYYEALSRGRISIVAPIASTGAALPVVVTLVHGDAPSALATSGLVVIIAGVILVAASGPVDESCSEALCRGAMAPVRPSRSDDPPDRASLTLALLAATAFGSYFLLVDGGTGERGAASTLWIVEGIQIGAIATTASLSLLHRREWALPRGTVVWSLVLLTVLNLLADLALVLAMGRGSVAVVSVLTSLAPVVTVALALVIREERPSRQQGLGAALAVLGTLSISATR